MLQINETETFKKKKPLLSSVVFSNEIVAELFFNIVPQSMRLFREEMRSHRSWAMSVPQFRILAQLWVEPTGNKELASRLGVSGAAMTRMVDSLVKEGLVDRKTNKSDRRSISIRLTKKGQTYFLKVRRAAILSLADKLSYLDVSLVDKMGEGLGMLSKALVGLQKKNSQS